MAVVKHLSCLLLAYSNIAVQMVLIVEIFFKIELSKSHEKVSEYD